MDETVTIKKQGTWVPSTVTGPVDSWSYIVTSDDRENRRNRRDNVQQGIPYWNWYYLPS